MLGLCLLINIWIHSKVNNNHLFDQILAVFRNQFLGHISLCFWLPCNLASTNNGSPAIICIFTRLLYMVITWWNQSTHMFIDHFVLPYWSAWMWPDTLLACIFTCRLREVIRMVFKRVCCVNGWNVVMTSCPWEHGWELLEKSGNFEEILMFCCMLYVI